MHDYKSSTGIGKVFAKMAIEMTERFWVVLLVIYKL